MSKGLKGHKYKITRKNPKTGFKETIWYEGSLRNKPKGWTVIK
jgi:hypothetical protein